MVCGIVQYLLGEKNIILALLLSCVRPGAIIVKSILNDKYGVGFASFCYFPPWNLHYGFVRGHSVIFSIYIISQPWLHLPIMLNSMTNLKARSHNFTRKLTPGSTLGQPYTSGTLRCAYSGSPKAIWEPFLYVNAEFLSPLRQGIQVLSLFSSGSIRRIIGFFEPLSILYYCFSYDTIFMLGIK